MTARSRSAARAALLSLALTACGGSSREAVRVVTVASVEAAPETTPSIAPEPSPTCTEWSPTVEVARLSDPRLVEVSGLVASRAHPGVLYVHNDSGEPYARFFAITLEGAVLQEIVLDGAPWRDVEDIAYHDGWLYLADAGDNGARDGSHPVHDEFWLLRVREPSLDGPAVIHTRDYERVVLRYPERARDCEAVAFDPRTGDAYFLSKENEGPVDVFVARAPLSTSAVNVLEHAGTMPGGGSLAESITALDVSSDGAAIVVRTYLRALLYPRGADESVASALARPPVELPVIREWQGEAIGFAADGATLLSIPEGDEAPVHALRAACDRDE